MNIRYLPILFLFFFILGPKPLIAQTTPVPLPSECADGIDNDKDGGVDKLGRTDGNNNYPADKQCLVNGAVCENGTQSCIKNINTENNKPASSASDFELQVRINNPLKVDSIEGAIQLFMNAVLRIALPFIIIFFIWSGFSFVLARGNPEKVKTAKNMFWYTIIGTLLILGAWTITNAIIGTVNSITG